MHIDNNDESGLGSVVEFVGHRGAHRADPNFGDIKRC